MTTAKLTREQAQAIRWAMVKSIACIIPCMFFIMVLIFRGLGAMEEWRHAPNPLGWTEAILFSGVITSIMIVQAATKIYLRTSKRSLKDHT